MSRNYFFLMIPMSSLLFAQDVTWSPPQPSMDQLELRSPTDLGVRIDRWETRFTVPITQSLLANPLQMPPTLERWRQQILSAQTEDLIQLSREQLNISRRSRKLNPLKEELATHQLSEDVPPPVSIQLNRLVHAWLQAQNELTRFRKKHPDLDLEKLIANWQTLALQAEFYSPRDLIDEKQVKQFDLNPYLLAAEVLTRTVDEVLPKLESTPFARHRFLLPNGDLLISGVENEVFRERDLENVRILIHLGKKSRYEGAMGVASPFEVQLVVDTSSEIEVHASTAAASVGAGMGGVALVYFPTPGVKTIHTGDFSQGVGVFGIGGFFVNGTTGTFDSRRFTQGASTFGVGLFRLNGASNHLTSTLSSQGYGFTRGSSLFHMIGNDNQLSAGLFYADPREDQAFLSLSQGVGYGPRAYAGGGVGIAYLQGNQNNVESSYFAQGAGYWHGLGGFFLDGNRNHLKARRYDQGSGIHTALGGFMVRGDDNQILNWGVGPSYGWDFGVGISDIQGDRNTFQTTWAPVHGEINGHGIFRLTGNENKLALPNLSTGALNRNAASYGIASIRGLNNLIAEPSLNQTVMGPFVWQTNLWGALDVSSTTRFDPAYQPNEAIWPKKDRTGQVEDEKKRALARIEEIEKKPLMDALPDLIDLSAGFGLDGSASRRAQEKLTQLLPEHFPLLIKNFKTDSVDQVLVMRHVIASYGSTISSSVVKEIPKASGTGKALLAGLLAAGGPGDGRATILEKLTMDPDWRVRRAALGVLGVWANQEEGRTQGRLAFHKWLIQKLESGQFSSTLDEFKKNDRKALSEKFASDIFPLLVQDPAFTRADVWDQIKELNHLVSLNDEQLFKLMNLFQKNPAVYATVLKNDVSTVEASRSRWFDLAKEFLKSKDQELVHAGLLVCGQIADPAAIPLILSFKDDSRAYLREASATALAKYGKEALGSYGELIASGKESDGIFAVRSICQNGSPAAQELLFALFDSPSIKVKETLLAGLRFVDWAEHPLKTKFFETVSTQLTSETEPQRTLALSVLKNQLK